MQAIRHFRLAPLFPLLAGVAALAGCSGSTEDVRVTFCKNLAIDQLSLPADVDWAAPKQTVRDQEYAIVTVKAQGGGRTSCWFEYEDGSADTAAHPDSLDDFSTLPYQVSVNGKVLSQRATLDAVNAEQRRMGRALVKQLRQAVQR
jgi:hypothetical protein